MGRLLLRGKVLSATFLAGALLSAVGPVFPQGTANPWPEASAQSVLVVDAETGQSLFEKAPEMRSSPAGLVQILTALILLEKGQQTQWATVTKNLPRLPAPNLGLKPGDAVSIPELAKAVVVASANDAIFIATSYLAGSPAQFAQMMNQRAVSLGLKNSHFTNPAGFEDSNQYSTAQDLTALARAALQNPEFRRLAAAPKEVVTIFSNEGPRKVAVGSSNKLLPTFTGCDGIKPGASTGASQSLTASATRDGWQIIATVLNSKNAVLDASVLMEHAFQNFRALRVAAAGMPVAQFPVAGGVAKEVTAVPAENLTVVVGKYVEMKTETVPRSSPLRAPIRAGDDIGHLVARLDTGEVYSFTLLAGHDVPASRLLDTAKDPRFVLALALLALAIILAIRAIKRRGK